MAGVKPNIRGLENQEGDAKLDMYIYDTKIWLEVMIPSRFFVTNLIAELHKHSHMVRSNTIRLGSIPYHPLNAAPPETHFNAAEKGRSKITSSDKTR